MPCGRLIYGGSRREVSRGRFRTVAALARVRTDAVKIRVLARKLGAIQQRACLFWYRYQKGAFSQEQDKQLDRLRGDWSDLLTRHVAD
jgi:hypothetical protein